MTSNELLMTKEELIRVKIIPELNSLANNLWDDGDSHHGRRLDNIIGELTNILNGTDDD